MSATPNGRLFAKYLRKISANIPLLFVGMNRFHVEKLFLENILDHPAMSEFRLGFSRERLFQIAENQDVTARRNEEILTLAYRMCDSLTRYHKDDPQCILVFLPGIMEIEDMLRHFEKARDPHQILILHSMIEYEDQMLVFSPLTRHRVILATNIAESSVTIPNVK